MLSNITMEAQEQECYAIVGKNGCGKTILLKLLTGVEKSDEGTKSIRKGATIGYLEQIPVYDSDTTVREIIELALEQSKKMYLDLPKEQDVKDIKQKKKNTYRIEQLEQSINELDIRLQEVNVLIKNRSEDYQALVELMEEKSQLEKKQELYMEEWMKLTM